MRKSLIAQSVAAVVAGLSMAGAAHAIGTPGLGGDLPNQPPRTAASVLLVNYDGGKGHINVVPYYSVQGGNDSYINIVNTDTVNGKAVKVRFRSASNSDDVFDFTLLMSPGDVFPMAVTVGDNGVPKVVTQDKTCTLPNNISGRSFVLDRLDPKKSAAEKANEAREGYVEILNMADIPKKVDYVATNAATLDLFNSIKHVEGVPRNCNSAAIRKLLVDVADGAAANAVGLYSSSSGLMTNWTVINVARATSFTGGATALEGRTGGVDGGLPAAGNIVFFPQTADAVANPNAYTADPLLRSDSTLRTGATLPTGVTLPLLKAASYDFPDLSTPLATTSPIAWAQALTNALAVASISNEYVTDPGLDAGTDWVFSSPTRRYSTALAYGATEDDDDIQLFSSVTGYYESANTRVSNGQICVTGIQVGVGGLATTADREERFAESDDDFVISPGTPAAPRLFCGEVSVLAFNNEGDTMLGANVAVTNLDTQGYADGWARIGTPGAATGSGLPIIGYAAIEIRNGDVGGVSANYGLTFPHRSIRPTNRAPSVD